MLFTCFKRLRILIHLLLLAALVLPTCGLRPAFCAEEKAGQWPPSKIIVAAGKDSTPYYFQDAQGRPQGWLVDLWRLWSQKTGIHVEFHMAAFGESVEMVRERRAAAHAGLFYSKSRDEFLDYVLPLAQVSTHYFHHKSILGIHGLDDLLPFRIGVIKGDYALEVLGQRLPDATLVVYDDNEDLFDAVARGEIKVFIKDTLIAVSILTDRGLMNDFTYPVDGPIYTKPFVAAVPQGEQRLPQLIKQGMQQISPEELAAIERRWSGSAQVRTKDILIVSCMLDNAPFTYVTSTGEPSGLFVDLWKLWGSRSGQMVEFRFAKWDQTLDDLAQGRADIHFGLYESENRSLWLDFSNPLYPVGTKLFTTINTTPSMTDMVGKRVGVLEQSYQEDFLRKEYPEITLVPFETIGAMVRHTANGDLAAFFSEDAISRETIDHLGLTGSFHTDQPPVFIAHLHAAVPKGRGALLDEINRGFANISNSELIELEERWIRDPQSRLFAQAPRMLTFNEQERQWLEEHPKVTLGCDPNWAPFEFIDQHGVFKGISSEYVRLFEERLGIDIVPQQGLTWSNMMDKARKGEIDIVSSLTRTREREEHFLFTSPFLNVKTVILTREEAPFISGLENLNGHKVAVVREYLIQKQIEENYPGIDLLLVNNIDEGLQAVSSKRAVAYVDSLPAINFTMAKLGLNRLKVAAPTPFGYDLAFAVRKDWPVLRDVLDKVMQSIPRQQKQQINDRWVNLRVERAIDWGYLWRVLAIVIAISLVVLVFITIWNRRLAREIENRKRAERELNDQLALQVALIDTIPNPIFIKDTKGRYVGCNKMYEQVFGTSRDAMWGKTVKDMSFLPPDKREGFYQEDLAIMRDRSAWHREMRLPFADGKTHDVLYWKVPFDLADGRLGGMLGVIVDISKLREAERELRKLTQAVEQSPVSVVMTNKQGTIEYVNPTFTEVTGFTAEEALGENPRILKGGEMPGEYYKVLWETILSGKTWKGDLINRKKSGQEFWESASISPIFDEQGEITHFVAVKEDITERKHMEDALHQAKEEAEEATRAKSDFLANMSHEVRTPMNAIMGMTHLALQTKLTAKQHDYLEKIDASARALLRIINDILDFSKIEAGKLEMESVPFHLEEVLDNLSSLVTVKAQEKGLEFLFAVDPDVPTGLVGDPLRLGQVLINLAGNAVKFTDKGEIVVAVKQLEQAAQETTLQFEVRDTGIGLTKAQQSKLFQAFSQADTSTTRKFGGTGLGLAICKRLVAMMHGEISVQSVAGQGSTFGFTARFGVQQGIKKMPPRVLKDFQGMKVLVVDDNETSRKILEQALQNFGFDVTLATTGAEALDILENCPDAHPFELVLMDWKMPGMDGIETSRRIKDHHKLSHIPTVIMVTAYGREEVMDRAGRIGLDGFLIKPVSQSVLFNTIMDAFGKEVDKTQRTSTATDFPEEDRAKVRGARILLVEDNEINQQVAKEILEGGGLVVSVASNGREALDKLKTDRFDAVLMDIQMPVLDGLEATRLLREQEKYKELPVIAMTAHAMAGDREKSLEAGMNDHVTKPIDPPQLLATLAKWVQGTGEQPPPQSPEKTDGQPEIALPDTLEGIDMDEGLTRMGGNRKLYRDLLVKFRNEYAAAADTIASLIDTEQTEEARRLAHSVKGVAGNLGAGELHAAASELEGSIHNGKDDLPAKLSAFGNELATVVQGLAAVVVEETEYAAQKSGDPARLRHLLEALEPHLRASKPKKCEPVLDEINSLHWPDNLASQLDALSAKIKKYRFKDAIAIVEQLLSELEES